MNDNIKLLQELRNKINDIEISYDYDKTYTNLRNTTIDYMNESQDWYMDYFFEDFIDYELAEDIAKHELETGGLIRLYYFLGNVNLNNEIFRIDGYGNLTDVDIDDFKYLKQQILDYIDDKIKENV